MFNAQEIGLRCPRSAVFIIISIVGLLLLVFVQFKLRFEKPCSFHSCPLGTLLLDERSQAYLWEDFLPGYPRPHHRLVASVH